ncbi:hypothetical protein [Bradyrhizobium sp. Tv2a-2]|uniref:hypothetical protein n=1 Tax=Bradyrhizobium sp. Tv2a-2 TaxID=113395 RepID=UPI00040EC307|nr:hypothetical protein [Bradyrhizobium sp. Tv2a-2]
MSISSLSSSSSYQTPLQKLEAELQSEVSNGTVSSSDETALSSALTDIDSAIKSNQSGDSTSGTKLSPADMQSKIDDLIKNEVSSGKLTGAQATELKGVFQATFGQGPGGPPPSDGTDSASSSTDSSSTTSSTTSSSDTSISELLQQFLQALQSSLSNSSSTNSYNASGTSTTSDSSSQLQAILIDYKT